MMYALGSAGLCLLLMGLGYLTHFFSGRLSNQKKHTLQADHPMMPDMAFFVGLSWLLLTFLLIKTWLPSLAVFVTLLMMSVAGWAFHLRKIKSHNTQSESQRSTGMFKQGMEWLFLLFVVYWLHVDMPLVAWDSWLGWELKAKLWQAVGFEQPFIDEQSWIENQAGLFNLTSHYPEGLPLLFWFGYELFGNNLWFSWFAIFAYVLVCHSAINRLSEQSQLVMFKPMAYALFLTMPLVANHLALFGYADLWVAMALLVVAMQLMDWNTGRNRSLLTLIFLMALLPMFKLEGWIWLSLLFVAQVFSKFLITRHRFILVGLVLLVLMVWLASGDWIFSWGARSVVLSHDFIQLGSVLSLSLEPQTVGTEIITGLFLQNNWGLVWAFMPFLMIYWLLVPHTKSEQVIQTFFLFSFAAFLVLFFFTSASMWAENYTAVNRIVLQLSLLYVYLLMRAFLSWELKGKTAQL